MLCLVSSAKDVTLGEAEGICPVRRRRRRAGRGAELRVGDRDGDVDPKPPGQAVHPPPAEELVPHLEVQADQQEDAPSVVSGDHK